MNACVGTTTSNPTLSPPPPHPTHSALRRLLPACDVVKMVCSAPPLLCSDIEGSITSKLNWIRDMVGACLSRWFMCVPVHYMRWPLRRKTRGRTQQPLPPNPTRPNPKPQVVGEVDEKIESNPRLLTCGYGVVFGRLEFVAQQTVRHARG